ncbi:MAG TPA: hypothetical protein VIM41_15885, partial [Gammaproteobacteria bacterium]
MQSYLPRDVIDLSYWSPKYQPIQFFKITRRPLRHCVFAFNIGVELPTDYSEDPYFCFLNHCAAIIMIKPGFCRNDRKIPVWNTTFNLTGNTNSGMHGSYPLTLLLLE